MGTKTKQSEKNTARDEKWDKALGNGELVKAYRKLSANMLDRYLDGKKGEALFGEEHYRELAAVTKAERKIYSTYLGKQKIESGREEVARIVPYGTKITGKKVVDLHYGDLSDKEKRTIDTLIEKTMNKHNQLGAYNAVEAAKRAVDGTYKTGIKADKQPMSLKALQETYSTYPRRHLQNFVEKHIPSAKQKADRVILPEHRSKRAPHTRTKITPERALVAGTMGLIAADIGIKLLEPEEKKAKRLAEEKATGKKKLTFGRVVSVAASVATLALAGLWTYRAIKGPTVSARER